MPTIKFDKAGKWIQPQATLGTNPAPRTRASFFKAYMKAPTEQKIELLSLLREKTIKFRDQDPKRADHAIAKLDKKIKELETL